jgi:hypothetical protein
MEEHKPSGSPQKFPHIYLWAYVARIRRNGDPKLFEGGRKSAVGRIECKMNDDKRGRNGEITRPRYITGGGRRKR